MNTPAQAAPKKTCPENTIFLVPEVEYDQKVIRGYLANKYANIPREMVASQFQLDLIAHVPGAQFIVCVRRGIDEQPLGPAFTLAPDEHRGGYREVPIKPETYWPEVVESAPIKVSDHVKLAPGQLFRAQKVDTSKLLNVLGEAAYPCRVTPQNPPDTMARCVWGG